MVVPRHVLPVAARKRVPPMRRPVALADDLPPEHEVLLAEELKKRRHVDELHAVTLGRRDHARVARADVRAAGLRRAAELAHGMNAAADALLRLDHAHAKARSLARPPP